MCLHPPLVKSVHFDTRDHGAGVIAGIPPQHRPLLCAPQGKGSHENENFRHGPSFMSTEYKTRYTARTPQQPGFPRCAVIGASENSGFTEESIVEPITHAAPSQLRVPRGFQRLMGQSLTQTDFLPSDALQGREPLPALARNSERDSGFSRETNKVLSDHAPHDDCMRQKENLLGQVHVGKKELSGFSHNNALYVQPKQEPPQQYLTNYTLRFHNPAPLGRDREGWTRGGIQRQQLSGFSLNNAAHGSQI
ncbi:hypothetical protein FKM82_021977 [Ascaphus truei]